MTATSASTTNSAIAKWLATNPPAAKQSKLKDIQQTFQSQKTSAIAQIVGAINQANAVFYTGSGSSAVLINSPKGLTYPNQAHFYDGPSDGSVSTITFYGGLYQNPTKPGDWWTGYLPFDSSTKNGLYDYYFVVHYNDYLLAGNVDNPWFDTTPTNLVYGDTFTITVPLLWAYNFYTSSKVLNYLQNMLVAVNASNASTTVKNQVEAQYTDYVGTPAKAVINQYGRMQANINLGKTALAQAETTYTDAVNSLIGGYSGAQSATAAAAAAAARAAAANSSALNNGAALSGNDYASPPSLPSDCSFNLPPHRASLPLTMSSDGQYGQDSLSDIDRRGRFWFHADQKGLAFTQSATSSQDTNAQLTTSSKLYGFQFLWNPESYSVNVQINDGVTPTSAQYWSTALPVFPGGESLSVSIVLDRTNDFASFGATQDYNQLTNYYDVSSSGVAKTPNPSETDESLETKIKDLIARGTLADIEYLYKTINGDGWVGPSGPSSDIGFLMMTLVWIELGPKIYLGYLDSLNITHTKFTQDMKPITSQLDMSFILMATAQAVQQSSGNSNNTPPKGAKK